MQLLPRKNMHFSRSGRTQAFCQGTLWKAAFGKDFLDAPLTLAACHLALEMSTRF